MINLIKILVIFDSNYIFCSKVTMTTAYKIIITPMSTKHNKKDDLLDSNL